MKKKQERKENEAGAGQNGVDIALIYSDEIRSSVLETMADRLTIQRVVEHLIGKELNRSCPYKTDRCGWIASCGTGSCPDSFNLTSLAAGVFYEELREDLRSFYANFLRKMDTQIPLYVDWAIREDKAGIGEPLAPEATQELLEHLRDHIDKPDDEQ